MKVEIRRLLTGDDALVMQVAEDAFDESVRANRLAAYLASPGHFMIVALADGVVVGQCAAVIHRHPDKVSDSISTRSASRPPSSARASRRKMLDAMFAIGREHGCEEAWVGTEPDNVAARALYESRKELHGPAEEFVMYVYEI